MPNKLFSQINRLKIWLILIAAALAVGQDLFYLLRTASAVGIDGYFYVLQVDTFLQTGKFYFSNNSSLVLYFLTLVSSFSGNTILSIKLSAALMHVLLSLGIWALIWATTNKFYLGAAGFWLAAFAKPHLYFISEFINNLGALMLIVWSVWGAVKFAQTKNKLWLVLTALLLIAALFCHRSVIGLSAIFLIVGSLGYLFLKANTTKTKLVVWAIFLLIFSLPAVLAQLDLPSFWSNEFLRLPQIPIRLATLPESLSLLLICLSIPLLAFRFPQYFQFNLNNLILIAIVLWSSLTTLNPFLNHFTGVSGVVGRLDFLAYLQLAVIVPLLISRLLLISNKLTGCAVVLFAAMFCLNYFSVIPLGLRAEYLENRTKLLQDLPIIQSHICDSPLIIAPHGEQFAITAVTKIQSQQKIPLEHRFQCVYWLLRLPPENSPQFSEALIIAENKFAVIEDSKLKPQIAALSKADKQRLFANNLHLRESLTVKSK